MEQERRKYNLVIVREKPERLCYRPKRSRCGLMTPRPAPEIVDLRGSMPPVYDQGSLGSCTANALMAAFEFDAKYMFEGSRLFLYYNERCIENNVDEDSGAYLRDGIESLRKHGVCRESLWPYDVSKYRDKPPAECYADGMRHQVLRA